MGKGSSNTCREALEVKDIVLDPSSLSEGQITHLNIMEDMTRKGAEWLSSYQLRQILRARGEGRKSVESISGYMTNLRKAGFVEHRKEKGQTANITDHPKVLDHHQSYWKLSPMALEALGIK